MARKLPRFLTPAEVQAMFEQAKAIQETYFSSNACSIWASGTARCRRWI